MSEEVIVDPAWIQDIQAIADIALELFSNNFVCPDRNPRDEALAWVRINNKSPQHQRYLVARVGKKIVGYAHAHTTAHASGVVAIDEWGKTRGCEIRGVGSRLIEGTERFWTEAHYQKFGRPLTALVVYTGVPGVGLCEKLGFVQVARMADLYGKGNSEYVLRKDI